MKVAQFWVTCVSAVIKAEGLAAAAPWLSTAPVAEVRNSAAAVVPVAVVVPLGVGHDEESAVAGAGGSWSEERKERGEHGGAPSEARRAGGHGGILPQAPGGGAGKKGPTAEAAGPFRPSGRGPRRGS